MAAREISSSSAYSIGKLAVASIGFLTVPLYSRFLAPTEFGVLSLAQGGISILGVFVGIWLTSSVVRFFPALSTEGQLNRMYCATLNGYVVTLVAVVATVGIGLVSARAIPAMTISWLLPVIGATALTNGGLGIVQCVLRMQHRAWRFVLIEVGAASLALGLVVIVLVHADAPGRTAAAVVMSRLAGMLLVLLPCAAFGLRSVTLTDCFRRNTWRLVFEFALYGFPCAVSSVGGWVLSLSDRYVIGYCHGTEQVGMYSMGYRLADLSVRLVVTSIAMAMTPTILTHWEAKGEEAASLSVRKCTKAILALGIPMALGLGILGVRILDVLCTPKYVKAVSVIPWVAAGALLYGLNSMAYMGLVVAKRSGVNARNCLVAAGLNLILNILFVPNYGYEAAAMTTTATYGVLLALSAACSWRYLHWPFPWKSGLRFSLAATVMTTIVWWAEQFVPSTALGLVTLVGLGVLVYGCFLWALGEFGAMRQVKQGIQR